MEKRVEQKITEMEGYLEELGGFIPTSFEEYQQDLIKKAAYERYFVKIMGVAKSLALVVLKQKDLPFPETDSAAYTVLAENYILNEALSQKLLALEQMNQVIINPDEFIEDAELYPLVKEELINSINEFIETIKELE